MDSQPRDLPFCNGKVFFHSVTSSLVAFNLVCCDTSTRVEYAR